MVLYMPKLNEGFFSRKKYCLQSNYMSTGDTHMPLSKGAPTL